MSSQDPSREDIGAPPASGIAAIARVDKEVSAIAAVLKALRKGESVSLDARVRMLQTIAGSIDALIGLRSDVQQAREEMARLDETEFLQLEANLREATDRRGWLVEGQWPTLYVQRGIDVTVNEHTRTVTVAGVKLSSHSLQEVLRTLDSEVPALLPAKFDAQAFVDALAKAFDGIAKTETRQVPIFDLYRQLVLDAQSTKFWRNALSSEFRGISIEQFRSRLSASLDSGVHRSTDGRELRLIPPLNPKDALFAFLPAERRFGYVGRIEFAGVVGEVR